MFSKNFINIAKKLPPEWAHYLSVRLLKYNLITPPTSFLHTNLQLNVLGKTFNSPLGIAAGFDKNAECITGLFKQGFSFVEAGTVTLYPQKGNLRPRVFRLPEDFAIINRLGFNNKGIKVFVRNLKKHIHPDRIIGVNIGRNRQSENTVEEYCTLIKEVYNYADYITINISSPNTPHLRELHKKSALVKLLEAALQTREDIADNRRVPLLIKISPDINNTTKKDIAAIALKYQIDGIILTNTTTGSRNNLINHNKVEFGGLSGAPLFSLSNKVLSDIYSLTEGKIILIGCGGISSAHQAYEKIKSGASLIQLYTALTYKGFGLVAQIIDGLADLLKKEGFNNISEAIGSDHKKLSI